MKIVKLINSIIFTIFLSLIASTSIHAQEVEKGQIPAQFLEPTLKKLPSDIAIWDEEETMPALKGETDVLLIDTRPRSFYDDGTFKEAIFLLYHKDEQLTDANKDETDVLTKDSLMKAMEESGKNKVMFFCQGPKCHRSYNAALRAVSEWGLSPDQVVWGRAGYPVLLQHIQADPKLERKMNKYFKGKVVSQ